MIGTMFTRGRKGQHKPRSSRRLAWVLALALLLPFAQALAWVHTLSHHGTQRADTAAIQLDTPCAICLGAAPLQSGALPGVQPSVWVPTTVQAAPPAHDDAACWHTAALAYRSRAPPLA
jgi:hypothetical protein